jgi:hypothetical protein
MCGVFNQKPTILSLRAVATHPEKIPYRCRRERVAHRRRVRSVRCFFLAKALFR